MDFKQTSQFAQPALLCTFSTLFLISKPPRSSSITLAIDVEDCSCFFLVEGHIDGEGCWFHCAHIHCECWGTRSFWGVLHTPPV